MNILFIYSLNDIQSPDKPLTNPGLIQMGISYISSVLKSHGHKTKLVVLSRVSGKINHDIVDRHIDEFEPKLIGFTSISTEYPFISEIAAYIKDKYKHMYLLLGGPHVTLNPDDILNDSFDALCIGEGEYPTLEYVTELENGRVPSGIKNLWIKQDTGIEKNPTRPFMQDLDILPIADRKMWDEWIENIDGAVHNVLLGRGCPFQCTYCSNHALKKLADGQYVRFRSPDNIIPEIKEVSEQYNSVKTIYLEVESIGVNKEWLNELCSKLQDFNSSRNVPLEFGANTRITPNVNYDEYFKTIKKANFKYINIGVESGSEKIRRDVLKRNYSNQDIIDAVKSARENGIKVTFFNLMGIPGETYSDFMETVEINRICTPDEHYTSIFYPYPGTDLYDVCKEQGLLDKPLDTLMERKRAALDLPGFSKKEIEKCFIWFDYYVYKGRKPLYKILAQVMYKKFRANKLLNSIYIKIRRIAAIKWLKSLLREY